MKNRNIIFLLCALSLVLIGGFQNCRGAPGLERLKSVTQAQIAGSICVHDASSPATRYRRTSFGIINLNLLPFEGQISSDSDMDGIADVRETALGYQADKARSDGKMLDGICQASGGPTICSASGCDAGKFNKIGLNQCDMISLNLNGGLDEDKDHIPDFIEILKGTFPSANDALLNPDNDNLNTLEEILSGRNPKFYDNDFQEKFKLTYSITPAGLCTSNQERWTFATKHLPAIETTAFTAAGGALIPPAFDFSHAANVNIFLIYYEVEVVGGPTPAAKQLWGTIKKVSFNESSVTVLESDFQKLGVVQ